MIGPLSPVNASQIPLPATGPKASIPTDPVDQAQLEGDQTSPQVKPDLRAALLASLAAVPLLGRLAGLTNVELLARKRFPLPFRPKTDKVGPEQAARLLEEESHRLLVQTSPDTQPMPLADPHSLLVLEVMQDKTQTEALDHSQLAGHLKQLKADGLSLTVHGMPVDPYGAYHYLTTGWPDQCVDAAPVEVRLGQLTVARLRPDQLEEEALAANVKRAREALTNPASALRYLCEVHQYDVKKVTQEMARLESGPQAESFRGLRQRFEQIHRPGKESLDKLESGLAIASHGALPERLEFLEKMGYWDHSGYYLEVAGNGYGELRQGGVSHGEALEHSHRLSKGLGQGYYRHEKHQEAYRHLGQLVDLSPAGRTLYVELVANLNRNPPEAAEQTRLVMQPVAGTTEEERLTAFAPLKKFYHPLGTLWDCYRADVEAGRPGAERLARLVKAYEKAEDYRFKSPERPLPAQHCLEHPERLDEICQLLENRIPPATISGFLDQLHSLPEAGRAERLQALLPLKSLATAERATAVLDAMEAHLQAGRDPALVSAEVTGMTRAVGERTRDDAALGQALEHYRDHLRDQTETTSVLTNLLNYQSVDPLPLLAKMQGWAGDSSLTERFEALKKVEFFTHNHGGPAPSTREQLPDALGELVAAGMPLDQAADRLLNCWRAFSRLSYSGADASAALGYVRKELVGSGEQIEFLTELAQAHHKLETASPIVELLRRPAGASTQTERFQAARDLQLIKAWDAFKDPKAHQAALEAFRAELLHGGDCAQTVATLQPLRQAAGKLPPETAASAFDYARQKLVGRPEAVQALSDLLSRGFPLEAATACLESMGSLSHLSALHDLGYAGLDAAVGRALCQELGRQLEAGVEERTALETLGRLGKAIQKRALPAAEGLETVRMWQALAGNPEPCSLFCQLLEHGQSPENSRQLQERLAPGLEGNSADQLMASFLASGGLRVRTSSSSWGGDPGVDDPGRNPPMALAYADLLCRQLAHGVPSEQASQGILQLQTTLENCPSGERLGKVQEATQLAGDSLELLGLYRRLHAYSSRHAENAAERCQMVRQPAGQTSTAERVKAFEDLRDNVHAYQAYQTFMQAGHEQAPTVERLRALVSATCRDKSGHAFEYAGQHLDSPEKLDGLQTLTAAGIPAHVASAALERAHDLPREVETLKGLGKGSYEYGFKPDEEDVQGLQQALHAHLASGVEPEVAYQSAAAVAQGLKAAAGRVMQEFQEGFAGQLERSQALGRLLGAGFTGDEALELLERVEAPVGDLTLTEKLDLGHWNKNASWEPGSSVDQAGAYYEAAAGQLRQGVPREQALEVRKTLWDTLRYKSGSKSAGGIL